MDPTHLSLNIETHSGQSGWYYKWGYTYGTCVSIEKIFKFITLNII